MALGLRNKNLFSKALLLLCNFKNLTRLAGFSWKKWAEATGAGLELRGVSESRSSTCYVSPLCAAAVWVALLTAAPRAGTRHMSGM